MWSLWYCCWRVTRSVVSCMCRAATASSVRSHKKCSCSPGGSEYENKITCSEVVVFVVQRTRAMISAGQQSGNLSDQPLGISKTACQRAMYMHHANEPLICLSLHAVSCVSRIQWAQVHHLLCSFTRPLYIRQLANAAAWRRSVPTRLIAED